MKKHQVDIPCPCGLGKNFKDCCQMVIQHDNANSPETLMRSRYSAYVTQNSTYLQQSWHSQTRPSSVKLHPIEWLGLTIVQYDQTHVEFIAFFAEHKKHKKLHETSRFMQEDGHWRYLDGQCQISDMGRNEPCLCGSTKKYKRCCANLQK